MTTGSTVYGGNLIDPFMRGLLNDNASHRGVSTKEFLELLASELNEEKKDDVMNNLSEMMVGDIEKEFCDTSKSSPDPESSYRKVKSGLHRLEGSAFADEVFDEKPRPETPSEKYMKSVSAVNHTAETITKDDLIGEIKKESESDFVNIKPKSRKLCSYTIDTDVIQIIEDLSSESGMNKSRFIEHLVKKYKAEKESTRINALVVANAAGPISLPIDKIAEKVFEHLVDNGYVNQVS